MANEQTEGSPLLDRLEELEKIDWEEVEKSLEQIKHLSERGWAIIGVSMLDEQLTALLRAFFVDDQRTANQMLEDTGILSTFGARIELAFLLGLISTRDRRMLNLIRKIRNDFAHNSKIESFSQSPIKDRCLELDVTKILWTKGLCDPRKPEEKFLAAVCFLLFVLVHRREQVGRREEAEAITEDYLHSMIKDHSREPT